MSYSFNVVYEDEAIFVLNKSANFHSVSISGSSNSVADDLLSKWPELKDACKNPKDAGLINRLDYATSGILIGAKSKAWHQKLTQMGKKGLIKKDYLAVLEGQLKVQQKVCNYIGSPYRRSKKVKVYKKEPPKGRALLSNTLFEPVTLSSRYALTVCAITIFQGRRHQIRAHSSFLGFPLLGDELYGSRENLPLSLSDKFRFPPFLLHAARVSLPYPKQTETTCFNAPLPEYFASFLKSTTKSPQD